MVRQMPVWMEEFLEAGVIAPMRMRAVERNAVALGLSTLQMMEAAGAAIAQAVRARSPSRVLLLCGRGNNGADGMAAARHLAGEFETSAICIAGEGRTGENRLQLQLLCATGVRMHLVNCPEEARACVRLFEEADLIVDALLGTGAAGALREPYQTMVAMANSSRGFILAADVPTPTMRADAILAFHRPKMEGSEVAKIGIPLEAEVFTGPGDLLLIPAKESGAHKGAGGKVLVVGGGPYQGAPYLAALAALRGGADLVRVASPVALQYPDLIHEPLEGGWIDEGHLERLVELSSWADVVALGCGMGDRSHRIAVALSRHCRRLVVDADALRAPLPQGERTIYTPHAGEFARMTGAPPPKDLVEMGRAVRRCAARERVILLKGPIDVISDGERVRFNRTGTSAMTVGGTGDVLTGTVAALFCRMEAFDAACIAAYVNGRAGERVAREKGDGLVASDLLVEIPHALRGE